MHLEYKQYLRLFLASLSPERFPTAQACLSQLEVADCPKDVEDLIGSNAAFQIASSHNAGKLAQGGSIDPLDVAKEVMRLHGESESQLRALFTLSLGTRGYINGTPSEGFCDSFLERVLASDGAALFTEDSLVVCPRDEEVGAAEASRFSLNVTKLLARAQKADNEDVRILLAAMSEKELSSENDVLMLLALLADPELEVKPYLEGLSGRQNIPWYLKRFDRDVRSFLSGLKKVLSPDDAKLWTLKSAQAVDELWAQTFLESSHDLALNFRSRYFTALRRNRPERVIELLLQHIRLFYGLYNRPEARAVLKRGDHQLASLIYGPLKVLQGLVKFGFGAIEMSCETSGFRTTDVIS